MGWLKDRFVYRPLAFAETAESIQQVHDVLQVRPGDTVAGIASSGDVLLSFLPCGPDTVLGYDFNPVQTAIARLRQELYRRMDRDRLERLLGLKPATDRLQLWNELKPHLGEHAAQIERLPIESGILDYGMSAWLSRMIDLMLRWNLSSVDYRKLLDASTPREERLRLYDVWRGAALNRTIAWVLSLGRGVLQHFFFPPAQVANSDYPQKALRDAPALLKPMFASGFADNPVVGRHMTGRIPSEHERLLFGHQAWNGISQNIDRISFGTAGIDAALKALPARSVDAIYLSNAPDYLKVPGLESFAEAVRHAAKPGARVFYLSLDTNDPWELQNVRAPWKLDRELASKLMSQDPVGVYRYLAAARIEA